ncbi:MAG: hypothetical protein RIF33_25535 [Cyclobacteriaceae bacterium]
MKIKMMLSIIAVAFVLFIAFGLYKASQLTYIEINKSVTIFGEKKKVFDMVKYLNNFPKWSPFLAQDPTQQVEVKGTDGTVGAQYHWLGNKGKDVGYQEIVKIDELSFVGMKCDIQKPFQAQPTFDYSFNGGDGNVTVTQQFKLSSGLIDAFFMWLFGVRKNMESTNEQGLQLLKQAVEKS